jgi:hypothetical protein
MREPPSRYRTLDRPGPGRATIAEPDGRVALWTLNLRAIYPRTCAQCGVLAGRNYRPSLARHKEDPRLCRACVEGLPNLA